MKNQKLLVLTPFIFSVFFFSSISQTNATDETPIPSLAPKPIDPQKVDRAIQFFNKGNQYAEKGSKERAR